MSYPDSLVNSLIVHLPGGGVRRVIRDDGENGVWISHPDHPNQMHKISREEFRTSWKLHKTESQQEKQDLSYTFDNAYKESNVVMNLQDTMRLPKETREPMSEINPRAEATDREAMKEAALEDEPLADVTSDGDPVGGNEEPLGAFDPLRTDDPDAAAEEVEAVADDAEDKAAAREEGVDAAAEEGLVAEPAEEAPKKGRRSKKDE